MSSFANLGMTPMLYQAYEYMSLVSSILFSVDIPAPCPAFVSIRISSGFGLSGFFACNVATYLKECSWYNSVIMVSCGYHH